MDPGEMAIAQTLAALRMSVNEAAGVKDRARSKRITPHAMSLIGVVAEFAFCKLAGGYPDLTIRPRSGGHDVIVNGKRWDIKGTDDKNRWSIVTTIEKKLEDADYYALAIVTGNVVEFRGWAPAAEVISEHTVKDIGYGPSYVLPPKCLRPFKGDIAA